MDEIKDIAALAAIIIGSIATLLILSVIAAKMLGA